LSQAATVAPLACVLLEHGSVAISNFFIQMSPTGEVLLPLLARLAHALLLCPKVESLEIFN